MPLQSGNKHQTLPLMGATRLASGHFSAASSRVSLCYFVLYGTPIFTTALLERDKYNLSALCTFCLHCVDNQRVLACIQTCKVSTLICTHLHSSALVYTRLHSSARNGYLALRGEALFSVMGGEVYGNGRQKNQILRQEIRSPCTQFCE